MAGMGKLALGLAIVGGVAVALSGGDANASTTRDPWTKPIDPPTDDEMGAVKQAFCTCFRGGATDEDTLTVCALKQVYGDEPWADLLTAVPGDSRELRNVIGKFRDLARELLAMPNEASITNWCGGGGPVIVDPPRDIDPVVDPVIDPPEDPKAKLRDMWLAMQSETAEAGKFRTVRKGDAGIEAMAREILRSAGIDEPHYQNLVRPMMVALSAGKRWNAKLYGRVAKKKTPNQADETWYSSDGQVIKPAWLPRHENANAAVLQGRMPKRNIFNDGDKVGPGSSYGTVYGPRFDVELARDQGVLVLDDDGVDPPAEFLALFEA